MSQVAIEDFIPKAQAARECVVTPYILNRLIAEGKVREARMSRGAAEGMRPRGRNSVLVSRSDIMKALEGSTELERTIRQEQLAKVRREREDRLAVSLGRSDSENTSVPGEIPTNPYAEGAGDGNNS